jgi:hypothetical protein
MKLLMLWQVVGITTIITGNQSVSLLVPNQKGASMTPKNPTYPEGNMKHIVPVATNT